MCLRSRVRTCWPVGTDQETFQLESDRLTETVRLLRPFGRMSDAGRPGRVPSTASTQDASSGFEVKRCDRRIILRVSGVSLRPKRNSQLAASVETAADLVHVCRKLMSRQMVVFPGSTAARAAARSQYPGRRRLQLGCLPAGVQRWCLLHHRLCRQSSGRGKDPSVTSCSDTPGYSLVESCDPSKVPITGGGTTTRVLKAQSPPADSSLRAGPPTASARADGVSPASLLSLLRGLRGMRLGVALHQEPWGNPRPAGSPPAPSPPGSIHRASHSGCPGLSVRVVCMTLSALGRSFRRERAK